MRYEMKKHFGFTLAETLITLGIIGVVAALTMPSLIQNQKRKEASTRIKKFYSVISQAIKLSEIENGPSLYWEFKGGSDTDPEYREEIASDKAKTFEFFDTYLDKYISPIKKELADRDEKGVSKGYPYFVLKDGSYVFFHRGGCFDMTFDLNGHKLPNQYGRDRFKFLLCTAKNNNEYFPNSNITFGPAFQKDAYNLSRTELLSKCKQGHSTYCTQLLMIDGWEFKDDYPLKL